MDRQVHLHRVEKVIAKRRRLIVWCGAFLLPAAAGPLWAVSVGNACPKRLVGTVAGFVMFSLLAVSSYTDLRWKRIPNWATYTALLWALAINLAASLTVDGATMGRLRGAWDGATAAPPDAHAPYFGPIGLSQSLQGAGTCFGIMVLVYLLTGSGAGDVKLATALGAMLGVERGVAMLLWCHILAGAAAICWLAWRLGALKMVEVFANKLGVSLAPHATSTSAAALDETLHRPVPLAAFFALGVFMALWRGTL